MRPQSPDTPPEIEEMILERYRRMTPGEKLRIVEDLNRLKIPISRAVELITSSILKMGQFW